jgi:hypothetical protein
MLVNSFVYRSTLCALVVATLACRGGRDSAASADSQAVAVAVPPPDAGTFTIEDFRRLRWLEGPWRGFMPDGNKFYERYRIVDDSTMVMHSFRDSTFIGPADSARITLRGGRVADEGGDGKARWVATRLDSVGVDFAPERGAKNHFSWTRESPTQWSATLRWTDDQGRPQTVVYALHKFGR